MDDKNRLNINLSDVVWSDLLRVHARLVAALDTELQAAGMLSITWYDVLITLDRAPDQRLRLSDLAEQVLLSRSGLTRLVDRIESAGLLKRERSAEDRRGAYAVLLPQGQDALRQAWPVYERLIHKHLGQHMTDEEAAVIHRVFTKVAPLPSVTSGLVALGIKRKPSTSAEKNAI